MGEPVKPKEKKLDKEASKKEKHPKETKKVEKPSMVQKDEVPEELPQPREKKGLHRHKKVSEKKPKEATIEMELSLQNVTDEPVKLKEKKLDQETTKKGKELREEKIQDISKEPKQPKEKKDEQEKVKEAKKVDKPSKVPKEDIPEELPQL